MQDLVGAGSEIEKEKDKEKEGGNEKTGSEMQRRASISVTMGLVCDII